MIEAWQEQINTARTAGVPLQIRGGGSKSFYGQTPAGEILDTRGYSGIVSYEPSELVVTARAGTRLAELEQALAAEQQILAFEPPHFGDATVGGCVAAGLSGPRRARAGPLRDFVLGCSLLDGRARTMRFGGQVMKNVAGYDVSRFLAGSLGILGVITEVSLKVLPAPELEQTREVACEQAEALHLMCQWARQPLPISATVWHRGLLRIRLSGVASAVEAAAANLGGELLDSAVALRFWQQLREQELAFFASDAGPLWRLALPATAPVLNPGATTDANTLLEWNGGQRWLRVKLSASVLREEVGKLGGHATLFRGGDKNQGVFTQLPSASFKLHEQLKHVFDPDAVFNRGRLYPAL
jgi:glycolate oxidase FAD binding subunit